MHFSLAFILFIRIFGFVNESNKQIDTFSQLRLPLIVLITFAHSYSGVRAGWSLWDGGWDTYEVLKLVVSETIIRSRKNHSGMLAGSMKKLRLNVLSLIAIAMFQMI